MDQQALNLNVQERLRALQANMEVFIAFTVALIETHPEREKLRKQFNFHYETLHGRWLNSELAEDFLDEAAKLHGVLDSSFDRPKP